MNPRLFLQFAKSLAATATGGPAELRSSISRSYYAAYLVAHAFLNDQARLEPRGSDKHSAVKNGLIECSDADASLIGMKLDTLHTQRKDADYEMTKPKPEKSPTALAASLQSEEIINGLDSISSDGPRLADVTAKIRAWAATPFGQRFLKDV